MHLLLADDDEALVETMRLTFQAMFPGGQFIPARGFVEALTKTRVGAGDLDAVLVDLGLLGPDIGDKVERLRAAAPGALILLFSGRVDGVALDTAEAVGAAGFLSKTSSPRAVLEEVTRAVAEKGAPTPAGVPLTAREAQILPLIRSGMSEAAIAETLGLDPALVRLQIRGLRKRLGMPTG